jgi:hypothetical protein
MRSRFCRITVEALQKDQREIKVDFVKKVPEVELEESYRN